MLHTTHCTHLTQHTTKCIKCTLCTAHLIQHTIWSGAGGSDVVRTTMQRTMHTLCSEVDVVRTTTPRHDSSFLWPTSLQMRPRPMNSQFSTPKKYFFKQKCIFPRDLLLLDIVAKYCHILFFSPVILSCQIHFFDRYFFWPDIFFLPDIIFLPDLLLFDGGGWGRWGRGEGWGPCCCCAISPLKYIRILKDDFQISPDKYHYHDADDDDYNDEEVNGWLLCHIPPPWKWLVKVWCACIFGTSMRRSIWSVSPEVAELRKKWWWWWGWQWWWRSVSPEVAELRRSGGGCTWRQGLERILVPSALALPSPLLLPSSEPLPLPSQRCLYLSRKEDPPLNQFFFACSHRNLSLQAWGTNRWCWLQKQMIMSREKIMWGDVCINRLIQPLTHGKTTTKN